MFRKSCYSLLFVCLLFTTGFSQSLVNTRHLDYLYGTVKKGTSQLGIVQIYAEFPDYHYVEAAGEGVTCVDDVARAAVVYVKLYKAKPSEELYQKLAALTRFQIVIQNENGYYNNFLFKDGSVNTTYRTSIAEPNWWSWRAMWSLASLYETIKTREPLLADSIKQSLEKAVAKVIPLHTIAKTFTSYEGFKIPQWLPGECGADQAAVLVKALCIYHSITKDDSVLPLLRSLCSGIMAMQVKDAHSSYNGAFLSWRNNWHAWGNSQADALLDAYKILKDKTYLRAALAEINSYYPYLLKTGGLVELALEKKGKAVSEVKSQKFSQIAYGTRPQVFACLNAYQITGDRKYLGRAVELCGWFFGNNPAKQQVYFPENGRCFDGILDETKLNKNSGAESTIEALLSLAAVEAIPDGAKMLQKKYGDKSK